jgi:hypothetical protein
MSMNWLEGMHPPGDEPAPAMAMPVFAGQKPVVVGGSRPQPATLARPCASGYLAHGSRLIYDDPARTR